MKRCTVMEFCHNRVGFNFFDSSLVWNVLLWKDLYVVAVELRIIHVNFISTTI